MPEGGGGTSSASAARVRTNDRAGRTAGRRRAAAEPATLADLVATLLARYEPRAFDAPRGRSLIRLESERERLDVAIGAGGTRVAPTVRGSPSCVLTASMGTWQAMVRDARSGIAAFRAGELDLRGNLHLAIGFLAATSGTGDQEGLRVLSVPSAVGTLSTLQAGRGEPVLMIHGLGATKAEFLPTLAELAPGYRVVAVDLPGFGDSVKPFGAPYDARFFADAVVALADSLKVARFHVVGHSLGGRVGLEVGLRHPGRVTSLTLLTPSMAWLRQRRWASLLRLVPPQLGVLQPTPRFIAERVVRPLVGSADDRWVARGVDEFLRVFCQPLGRAAFYAAARSIYLEEPSGDDGMWTRLAGLGVPSLFVWGRRDALVPPAFARHVARALPSARHLVVDSGHLPQFERPAQTHAAVRDFLDEHSASRLG